MSFHVGQKVVCVDDKAQPGNNLGMHGLVKGEVYTIREIGISPKGEGNVWLVEIERPFGWKNYKGRQLPFRAWRFRPIVENKSKASFTMGADPDSERWDNRVKVPTKA